MSQSTRPADRKIDQIRNAARALRLRGDDQRLADLLDTVARAYDGFREEDLANIDEALRWTPVLYAATRVARSVL